MSSGAERRVTINEATLNVVGVSIKAVQIGKKQMTLSVFRQLPNESIWDWETFEPIGEMWGRVNYFWVGCGCIRYFNSRRIEHYLNRHGEPRKHEHAFYNPADAVHIIWQSGAELRRSCVSLHGGESASLYPIFYVNDDDADRRAYAWGKFYRAHIAQAEQLFIAV